MICSNGVCHITEIEARLGDILAKCFPRRDESLESHLDAKRELTQWAEKNGIRFHSFWDYTPTKAIRPEVHFVPSPHPGRTSSDTFLHFPEELALKVLFLGEVPRCDRQQLQGL